jgi:hypothetical protein
MPTPLQYPLERCRALQERWLRPLDHQPPPDRDDDDDEDDDEEDEEEAEPAVIREPDEDE